MRMWVIMKKNIISLYVKNECGSLNLSLPNQPSQEPENQRGGYFIKGFRYVY